MRFELFVVKDKFQGVWNVKLIYFGYIPWDKQSTYKDNKTGEAAVNILCI